MTEENAAASLENDFAKSPETGLEKGPEKGLGNQESTGLEVRDATVTYGKVQAVKGVSLRVEPGEFVALLGPSGSGKSSLLRAIAGLEPLSSGSIWWDGVDVTAVPTYRRGFGMMFQDGQLFPHRDVAGNVAYGLVGKLPRAQRQARVEKVLQMVGLSGYEDREVGTLSGGQAQRVALARSLAPLPPLLLLDEPLSALDADLRGRLGADIRRVIKETGTTAIMVTHDAAEAEAMADRSLRLVEGRLV